MAFNIAKAAGKLLIVAACGIGVLHHADLINSAEYPLRPLTQTLVRHLLEPGLAGPADESYTAAAMRLAGRAQALGEVVSDYVLCCGAPHGVLIIAEHDTVQAAALEYFKLGDGPFYSLLRPNIFVHLEIPRTIRSIMRGDVLIAKSAVPRVSVAAVAKREVAAGEGVANAAGSFEFRGSAVRIA